MTIDLTEIINATIAGLFGLVGTVFLAWLAAHMKDQKAAATIGNAVHNALGAMQEAATTGVAMKHPAVTIPVGPVMAAGIAYVLEQAKPELARYPEITQADIAAKLRAQAGLAAIAATGAVPAIAKG